MSTAPKNMKSLVEELARDIEKLINSHLSKHKEISLGTDTAGYNGRCTAIRSNLFHANRLLSLYTQFLTGKTLSVETFKEILGLPLYDAAELDKALRIAHLTHYKVALPKFRLDALAMAYDFESQSLALIEEIKVTASDFVKTKKCVKYYDEYFNKRSFKFELSADQENQVKDLFTKKATAKDILAIISREFIVSGLNGLKGHIPSGNLRVGNDHPIKGIDYDLSSDSYHLNWNELVGEMFEQNDEQLDIQVLPVMEHELPKVVINGRIYQCKAATCLATLNGSGIGMSSVKVDFKDALYNDPELFFRVVAHLLKKKSGILVDIGAYNEKEVEAQEA